MLTKNRKPSPEKLAAKELKRATRPLRKKQKRLTTLIRIQKIWKPELKARAWDVRKTISKLHDEIYLVYFTHVKKQEKPSLKGITL